MILDKLVEKKDILTYIAFRIEVLLKERKELAKKVQPEQRQFAIKQLEGRIKELKTLKKHIHKFKDLSKKYWADAAIEEYLE